LPQSISAIDSANDFGPVGPARLHDVARRAGVSPSTASRALNGVGELAPETRAAVVRAAAELSYRPSPQARSLRTRRSMTIGLVVPTISHAFYGAVTHGVQAVLDEHDYRLVLVDSTEDPLSVRRALETLLDQRVDGLLVSTAPIAAADFNELLGSTPCVFVDELAPGSGVGNIALENARGVTLLVDHLAEHGHRRIAYMGGPLDRTSGRERLQGFLDAMERRDLPVEQALVREGRWTIASGFEEGMALMSVPDQPTALITASGELALGALAATRRRRIAIPDQLALVCFDDLYFAPLLQPSLTAVAYDARAMGTEAARLLLAAMEDGDPRSSELRIAVSLVRRRSCGCDYDPAAALAEVVA
jgi:LacI family transcriptional regulator